jgi:beta-glucanase (GH16 family)
MATDDVASISCRDRIQWAMNNLNYSEEQACSGIGTRFPDSCGQGCDPTICGAATPPSEGTPPGPLPGPPPASPPDSPPPGPRPEDGELVFAEEFDEGDQPNPAIWSYDQGDWGWGNAELQRYTNLKENVQISQDGKLVITAIRQGASITSGRIKTLNKFTLKYGRVEASIKVPDLRDGLWPAFWTLGNNFPVVGWPKCGEIDIMEMGNAAPGNSILNQQVGSAAHWFNDPQGRATYGLYLDTGEDLSQGFHTFSMDWTPDMITTYVDGNQIWAIDISPEQCPPEKCSEFHDFHFLLLNLAVGGSYTGLLSPAQITATFPARYEIDYIRVYANEWTEVGGSYITGGPTLKYDLTDCGCPATCTNRVLDLLAQDSNGNFSCRDRIEWVIGNLGATEGQACRTVSGEFLSICGQGCNPDAC